jgi:hypothetical protein
MSEGKDNERETTGISKAYTDQEVGEYWDTHSLAEHWDQTYEVEFNVRAQRRHRVTLDPDLSARVQAQARTRSLSPETLVNLWLAERLNALGNSQAATP